MGWAVGEMNGRDVGYGVPAYCDYPDCFEEIDRGLSYRCGGSNFSDDGCGLFFCLDHLDVIDSLCERCENQETPFSPKPDHPEWVWWKLHAPSWKKWRRENLKKIPAMQEAIKDYTPDAGMLRYLKADR